VNHSFSSGVLTLGSTRADCPLAPPSKPSEDSRALCNRYFLDRQTECVSSHAAWSSDYYGEVRRFSDFPFWKARSARTRSEFRANKLASTVRRAKVTPASKVRISESVCLADEPCIVDDEIKACVAVSHPTLDRPVAFLDGIEISRLLEMVPNCTDLESLLAQWALRFTFRKVSASPLGYWTTTF